MPDMDDVFMMLGEIRANQLNQTKDISEMKVAQQAIHNDVSELKTFKVQVVTFCTAASATVSVIITAITSLFKSHPSS